jgi:uncharacterized membrane protein
MNPINHEATVQVGQVNAFPIQLVEQLVSVGSPILVGGVAVLLLASVVAVYTYNRGENNSWSVNDLDEEEKQVVELLESHNGKVKQKKIATEIEWSDAKASRLTTSLEEKNVIVKKMIERENQVELNSSDRRNKD